LFITSKKERGKKRTTMWTTYRTLYVATTLSVFISLLVVSDGTITTTTAASAVEATGATTCHGSAELIETHPVLCNMLDRVEEDIDGIVFEMNNFARKNHLLVGNEWEWEEEEEYFLSTTTATMSKQQQQQKDEGQQLPIVFGHGMGDSCFNSGMINIVKHTSSLLNDVYVTCIPTGDTKTEDTKNGYFLNMDASVDVFASKILQDPKLKNGFHAIGFSQGNNVIRGYIARYNTPTVHTFISVNGVNAGEGTVPGCFPNNDNGKNDDDDNNNSKEDDDEDEENKSGEKKQLGGFCDLLVEQASRRAYTDFAQQHSFQANYWRDPRRKEKDAYHTYSQLARWNNEGPNNNNQTLVENYGKTSKFVWIMATHDTMVWPKEGEHWGCPDDTSINGGDPFTNKILPMNETEWYQHDLFGLKTAQELDKNVFLSFKGDHLRFSMDEFDQWVKSYLVINDNYKEAEEPSISTNANVNIKRNIGEDSEENILTRVE